MDSKTLIDGVLAKAAADAVASITPEQRRELMKEAVEKQITGHLQVYGFRTEIDKIIGPMQLAALQEYVDEPEVRERIRQRARLAGEKFIDGLIDATLNSMASAWGAGEQYPKANAINALCVALGVEQEAMTKEEKAEMERLRNALAASIELTKGNLAEIDRLRAELRVFVDGRRMNPLVLAALYYAAFIVPFLIGVWYYWN